MVRVLLIHAGIIPHYRIPIYSYLSEYLSDYKIELIVISDGIQLGAPDSIMFNYTKLNLSTFSIAKFIAKLNIYIIIDYMELKHKYLFPTYFIVKYLMRRKMIYWGQGCDLLDSGSKLKNYAYAFEQSMCNSLILYADHLKKYVPKIFHKKVFVANNTLFLDYPGLAPGITKENILSEYGIKTKKNIICVGRLHKRKRLDHLVLALYHMNRPDVGLILVGPDKDGVLDSFNGENIYKLGPIYGNRRFDLISASDIYCLPGAVGLSIIDAFCCGIPFVTEDGDESAEIMYLKDGINGFVVKNNDIEDLSKKLEQLLDDPILWKNFSDAAKKEFFENANIDKMCKGFRDAILFAMGSKLSQRI